MGSSNSSFTTKSDACACIAFLAEVISLSVGQNITENEVRGIQSENFTFVKEDAGVKGFLSSETVRAVVRVRDGVRL